MGGPPTTSHLSISKPIGARPSLTNLKHFSLQHGSVKAVDCGRGLSSNGHIYKAESPFATIRVFDDFDGFNPPEGLKRLLQVLFGGLV